MDHTANPLSNFDLIFALVGTPSAASGGRRPKYEARAREDKHRRQGFGSGHWQEEGGLRVRPQGQGQQQKHGQTRVREKACGESSNSPISCVPSTDPFRFCKFGNFQYVCCSRIQQSRKPNTKCAGQLFTAITSTSAALLLRRVCVLSSR